MKKKQQRRKKIGGGESTIPPNEIKKRTMINWGAILGGFSLWEGPQQGREKTECNLFSKGISAIRRQQPQEGRLKNLPYPETEIRIRHKEEKQVHD